MEIIRNLKSKHTKAIFVLIALFDKESYEKYSFKTDYSEGTHPQLIEALSTSNMLQEEGYCEDSFCINASKLIRQKIKQKDAAVHFVSGGTQANLVVLSSMLKPYESVVSADTAHIAMHETGAIEASGHKINTVRTETGKLTVENIKQIVDFHTDEHMVKPKAVFVSNSTELGSIYKLSELQEISTFCKKNKLFLYLDGARLASALSSKYNDLSLEKIAQLVDAFYIGGTKNGALFGEAIVIINKDLQSNFRFYLKQKGALLAKGRILGIQFLELFKNDLYWTLAEHANKMALKLAEGIKKLGHEFLLNPETNQIFPILPENAIQELAKKYEFYIWHKVDNNKACIRLVTSWATKEEAVDSFLQDLKLADKQIY